MCVFVYTHLYSQGLPERSVLAAVGYIVSCIIFILLCHIRVRSIGLKGKNVKNNRSQKQKRSTHIRDMNNR